MLEDIVLPLMLFVLRNLLYFNGVLPCVNIEFLYVYIFNVMLEISHNSDILSHFKNLNPLKTIKSSIRISISTVFT